jgi:hypothetical protein
LIAEQRKEGVTVHEISNDGTLAETWQILLETLGLPYIDMETVSH